MSTEHTATGAPPPGACALITFMARTAQTLTTLCVNSRNNKHRKKDYVHVLCTEVVNYLIFFVNCLGFSLGLTQSLQKDLPDFKEVSNSSRRFSKFM